MLQCGSTRGSVTPSQRSIRGIALVGPECNPDFDLGQSRPTSDPVPRQATLTIAEPAPAVGNTIVKSLETAALSAPKSMTATAGLPAAEAL